MIDSFSDKATPRVIESLAPLARSKHHARVLVEFPDDV